MPPPKDPIKLMEYRLKLSVAGKGRDAWNKGIPQTPETKFKLSQSQLGVKHWNFGGTHSEKTKLKMRVAALNRHKSPDHCRHISEAKRGKYAGASNPFYGKHHSKESLEKMSMSHKGVLVSEETKRKLSNAHKTRLADPELRYQMKERQMGEKSHLWKGGVSFEPYCPKFNREFKERVRTFFGGTCIECKQPQVNSKLSVHHIGGNKQTCCDDTQPKFVPLCKSCHGKVTEERDMKYKDIIDKVYGGKCYLTKDEMKQHLRGG